MNKTACQTSQASQAQFAAFIGRRQLATIITACRGEEGAWFRAKLAELAQTFATMHKVYEQGGKGDAAIVHLHYFTSSGDLVHHRARYLGCSASGFRLGRPWLWS